MSSRVTPSQTVGPFFSIGLDTLIRTNLTAGSSATPIEIRGRVLDGDNLPVPDALLEIWQADENGQFPLPLPDGEKDPITFQGFGRIPTSDNGEFSFTTIKPGPIVTADDTLYSPHLQVSLLMRGLLRRLVTRLYFPNEPLNESDPILHLVPFSRRATLVASTILDQPNCFEWNIHLQGPHETVFFEE